MHINQSHIRHLIAAVGCAASVLPSPIAAEPASSLAVFGGNIEQTTFTVFGSFVTVERKALDPKTGETQHIKFKAIPAPTEPLAFDPHALPKEIESGFLHTRDWDAYWDLPKQHWCKIPKGATNCVGASLDENSVVYNSYTLFSDLFGRRVIESTMSGKTTGNKIAVPDTGSIRVKGNKPGEEKTATFDVAGNGLIRSVEISQSGGLEKKVVNEIVQVFSFAPDVVDSTLYDQLKGLTLENDGRIGLNFDPRPGELIIASVAPASPAADQRVAVGDRVVSVNGIPLRQHTVEEFQNLAKGSATVLLGTVSPDGSQKRYTVQKALFISRATSSQR